MSLSLTVDHNLRRLAEPGYWTRYSTRDLADIAVPADAAAARGFWSDPVTRTIMLYPLQLRPDWLNTSEQVSSILRLSDMVVAAADTAAGRVFEANLQGNSSNPWIHHAPISPSSLSPFTGIEDTPNIANLEPLAEGTLGLTVSPPGLGGDASSDVAAPAAVSDGRFICGTKQKLAANQALYLRWWSPEPRTTHQTAYAFIFAQYCLMIRDSLAELFQDASASGDKSTWVKVSGRDLFSPGPDDDGRNQTTFGRRAPLEPVPHYRSLLILPFRRNRVLFLSNFGRHLFVRTGSARRIADPDNAANEIWDITRRDTLSIWALTPSPGHFQCQLIKWKQGPINVRLPHVRFDYTPTLAVTATLDVDTDRTATAAVAVSDPPGYTLPVNTLDTCPDVTDDPTDQTKTYGVTLTLNSSSDQRWSPFFYGLTLEAPRRLDTALTAAVSFLDVDDNATRIQQATITVGEEPGEGKMTATLLDFNPFAFGSYYYRSGYVVRLADFTAPSTFLPHFIGLTEPNQVVPLRFDTDMPRSVSVQVMDLWKALVETYPRDNRDYGAIPGQRRGYGHITAVRFLVEQAGIDLTGADTPATGGALDWPLQGLDNTVEQIANDLNPGWKPGVRENVAAFVKRVAALFSGWVIGFHADGQFYYHPRDQYTSVAATFYKDNAARVAAGAPTAPLYRSPVEFRTEEPQANVVQVVAGRDTDGSLVYSALFVDWASILNVNAVNFIGRWKPSVLVLGGTFACGELNRMARIVFDEARRRKRFVQFRGDYLQGLKCHRPITVSGYGTFRLKNYSCDFIRHNWHDALYEAELIEAGHGV